MVTAAIGLDVQQSHSTAAEWEAKSPGTVRSVGDGTRRAIPHAWRDPDVWATAAVSDLVLSRDTVTSTDLMPWLTDPWSVPYLTALARRLGRYIGLPGATHVNGYHVWVVGDGEPTAERLSHLAEAGLPDVTFVDPAEAVLAEWVLGATHGVPADQAFRGPVVVVACGEDGTIVDAFRVDGTTRPIIMGVPVARRRVPHGIGPVRLRVANEVLRRRIRLDLPVNVLALLAVVGEYGQILAAQPDRWVEWDGPLADALHSPLRLSQADLHDFTESRALVDPVQVAIQEACAAAGSGDDVLVVLGGPGAGWSCLRVAAGHGRRLAVSADPGLSLAAGACFWSAVRRLVGDVWSEPGFDGSPAPASAPTGRVASGVLDGARRRSSRVPEWMR